MNTAHLNIEHPGLINFKARAIEVKHLFAPPVVYSLSDWAEKNYILSPEYSAEPGAFTTDRVPFQRDILNAISNINTEIVVVVGSTQWGKTLIQLITMGYYIEQEPSPILFVMDSDKRAEDLSKDRIKPMERDNVWLQNKFAETKGRDKNSTIMHKNFRGGHLTLIGANAPGGLASRPIRILCLDEVDRYPLSAGTEGNPVKLAMKRTETFDNRKIIITSSPGIEGASRIWPEFELSNQQYFNVPCIHCGGFQRLEFKQLRFSKLDPTDYFYQCIHCAATLTESDKYLLLKNGKWIATHPERTTRPGFHINKLYSPWASWPNIIAEFIDADKKAKAGDVEDLKVFVNTTLAELWKPNIAAIEKDVLLNRVEKYFDEPTPLLPSKVCYLTAGVDVQDNRLECKVKGWAAADESYLIEVKIIPGNPALHYVWNELDIFLQTHFHHAGGLQLAISAAAIDTGGHHTDAVYNFVKGKEHRRIYATKGSNQPGKPIAPAKPSFNNAGKIPLYFIGTDTAKEKIFARLKIETPGAGYMHFNHFANDDYFEQLTSEKQIRKRVNGLLVPAWQLMPGRRNEMLDCEVLNIAALKISNPNINAISLDIERRTNDAKQPKEQTAQPVQKIKPPTRRNNFANSWR